MLHRLIFALLFWALSAPVWAQGGLIFYDEFFDNRNDWPIINSEIAITDLRDGFYFLQHLRTIKSLSVKRHIPIDTSRDYMIVVELVKFDKDPEKSRPGFGILWGREDEDNEYNFLISANGSFKILRMFQGRPQTIVDWMPSKYIEKENGLNRLSIKKVGEEMYFYINHHRVAVTKEMPFFNDLTGIKVYHMQKIGVRSFKVYQN